MLCSDGATRWPALLAIAAFAVAAVLAYSHYLSPRARVRGMVMEMARAFEQEDVNRVMDPISKDYRDSSNLVRADVEDFLVFYFEEREDIKVDIKSVRVMITGEQARAFVRGTITFTTRAGQRRIAINRPPMILRFKHEIGVWRLVRAENTDFFVEE
jgi:hypothetical protein